MYIVTAKEMYDIDRYTIEEIGLPGKLLMENAGREIYRRVEAITNKEGRFTVLVGAGNNGGDGFVIARYLLDHHFSVQVVQVVPDDKITNDAKNHKDIFINSGGSVRNIDTVSKAEIQASDYIIDALLGIGLKGELRSPYKEMIEIVNEASSIVISVDIPSGLPADPPRGSAYTAIKATYTFVVGAAKMSAFLPETSMYYGEWEVVDMGFSERTIQKFTKRATYQFDDFKQNMPVRYSHSHKGDHGKGLLIGGSTSMPGSITMATQASLVAGAGLITAATLQEVIPNIALHSPEAMMHPVKGRDGHLIRDEHLTVRGYDAIAIGVGMGRNKETGILIRDVLQTASCPVIVDADGLYHLAEQLSVLKARKHPTILTPHAGEMARLLDITPDELLLDPFYYTKMFALTYKVYVVLKGKQTIITSPDEVQVVDSTGNPGLAKGGSGDVLTGIMLATVVQNTSLFPALCNACFLHGTSADIAVESEKTIYDLVATDVIQHLGEVYRMISD